MKNIIIKTSIILLSIILIGYIFLYYSYKINFKNIEDNLLKTISTNEQVEYYFNKSDYNSINSISFTELIMISEALLNDKNALISSAKNLNISSYNNSKKELISLISGSNEDKITAYSRYWHGYLFPLKLLLNFFKLPDIKLLNYIFVLFLLIMFAILMYKNNLTNYLLPILSFIIFMVTPFLYIYISNSIDVILMFIYSIFLLLFYKKIKRDNIKYIFLIMGALTSYFDLFTFPLFALCFPLMIYLLLLNKDNIKDNRMIAIKSLIINSIFWIIGYAGMWAGKWLISSIILRENIFTDAIDSIKYRTSGVKISFNDLLFELMKYYINKYFIVILIINYIFVAFQIIKFILNFKKLDIKRIKSAYLSTIPFLILSLYPFIWLFIVRQHSYEHPSFSSRLLAIPFICIFISIHRLIDNK